MMLNYSTSRFCGARFGSTAPKSGAGPRVGPHLPALAPCTTPTRSPSYHPTCLALSVKALCFLSPRCQHVPSLRQRRALQCRAISLPENIDATLRNVISISSVVGISYAVLLSAVSAPPAPPTPSLPPSASPAPLQDANRRALGPGADVSRVRTGTGASAPGRGGEDDNFVWGLMGFISFLPLFNWLAWVLAAISDEDRAVLYGTYAALYGTPLLLRGLNWQDPWCLFMLVLCITHVQVERIAQTEPETLRSIQPVGAVGALLRGAVGGIGAFLSGLGGVLAEDSRRVVRRPGGNHQRPPAELGSGDARLQLGQDPDLVRSGSPTQDPRRDPSRDPELEDYATRELRQFDEQLKKAEQEKNGRRGGGGAAGGGRGR